MRKNVMLSALAALLFSAVQPLAYAKPNLPCWIQQVAAVQSTPEIGQKQPLESPFATEQTNENEKTSTWNVRCCFTGYGWPVVAKRNANRQLLGPWWQMG